MDRKTDRQPVWVGPRPVEAVGRVRPGQVGWHVTALDGRCFKAPEVVETVGTRLRMDNNRLQPGEVGFHACDSVFDCLRWVPGRLSEVRLFRVSLGGIVLKQGRIFCASEREALASCELFPVVQEWALHMQAAFNAMWGTIGPHHTEAGIGSQRVDVWAENVDKYGHLPDFLLAALQEAFSKSPFVTPEGSAMRWAFLRPWLMRLDADARSVCGSVV